MSKLCELDPWNYDECISRNVRESHMLQSRETGIISAQKSKDEIAMLPKLIFFRSDLNLIVRIHVYLIWPYIKRHSSEPDSVEICHCFSRLTRIIPED